MCRPSVAAFLAVQRRAGNRATERACRRRPHRERQSPSGQSGSDLFKGVAGGMHFVNQVARDPNVRLQRLVHRCPSPVPALAARGRRALVTAQHKRLKAKRSKPAEVLVETTPPKKVNVGDGPEKMEEDKGESDSS